MKKLYLALSLSAILIAQDQIKNDTNNDNTNKESKAYRLNHINTQASMSNLSNEYQSKQVSVISKDVLLNSLNQGNVQSILEKIPGILYSRSGGVNGQISFRGQNSNFTRSIVMIDGVRVTGRNTLEFNTIDPNSYDQIEVIRGAASSLWGSDAMNGIVNFRSRKSNFNVGAETFSVTARVRALQVASVNNLLSSRVELLGGGAGWDVLLGISGRIADSYKTPLKSVTGTKGTQKVENSNFNSVQADLNLGYSINNFRYYLNGLYTRVESHRGGGVGAAPGSNTGIFVTENPISQYYFKVGADGSDLGFADKVSSYLYFRHWDTDIWNDRIGFNGKYVNQKVYNNNYIGGRLSFDTSLSDHSLVYGVEFESSISPTAVTQIPYAKGKPTNAITINRPSTNTDIAAFIKDDWKVIDPWILSFSARGDYILTTISKQRSKKELADIGKESSMEESKKVVTKSAILLDQNGAINQAALTGAIGSVFFFNDYLSNVINISHNFKSPSSGARMSTTPAGNPMVTIANPLIKSEYSQSGEFGFRFQSDNHFVSVVGFVTSYTNMLTLSTYQSSTAAKDTIYRYENTGKALIAGAELEGLHHFMDDILSLEYNLSYNYGQDLSKNQPLAYVAPIYGQLSLGVNLDHSFFKLTERFYGAKTRISVKEERKTKAYAMTDFMAGVKLGYFASAMNDMEIIFGVENIFDAIGRNPTTHVSVKHPESVTNSLIEPGINFSLKYAWKY